MLSDVHFKLTNDKDTTYHYALKLVGAALESQVSTKKLSLKQLELTHIGLAKLESFTEELLHSRKAKYEAEQAFFTVFHELQKALKEDKVAHVDTSTHTNRVHEAVNMVHEIVRRGAFSTTDACSSTTSLTFVPKPPSLAKNGLASTAESLIFSDEWADDDPVIVNLQSSTQEYDTKTHTGHTEDDDRVLTPKLSHEQLSFEYQKIWALIQKETSSKYGASCLLAHFTELVAAQRSAEEATEAAHARVDSMKQDVSSAWNVLAIPREAPTRRGVEGFVTELESLLQEKDAVTVALAQLVDDRRCALESAIEAKQRSVDHANALIPAESELLFAREQNVALKTHACELAEVNHKTRRQLAAARSRLQQLEREKEVIIVREGETRRRADSLQVEARELRCRLTTRAHEAHRHASIAKKACADLERERVSTHFLKVREQWLEVKVRELASELARRDTDSLTASSIQSTTHIIQRNSSLAAKELGLLVQELAQEERRAKLRAVEAESVAANAFAEVRALKAQVNEVSMRRGM